MLATFVAVLAISLRPGTVVTLPPRTPLVASGLFNWALREPAIVAPSGTRALVVRIAPGNQPGVVEVKLFDGTDRHCWLEDVGLTTPLPPVSEPAGPNLDRSGRSVSPGGEPRHRRRKSRPNFAEVDAALASMAQSVMRAQESGPTGPAVFTMPVFNMEVFTMPVFTMPVFQMDTFQMPIF